MNVLDVLMYLYMHHMKENCDLDDSQEASILETLTAAGFHHQSIIKAISWLSQLSQENLETLHEPNALSFRVFNENERNVITPEIQGLLLSLEQQHILTPYIREIVIHQILELERDAIDIDVVKWIILMVLFSQPNEKTALATMENLVLNDKAEGIH